MTLRVIHEKERHILHLQDSENKVRCNILRDVDSVKLIMNGEVLDNVDILDIEVPSKCITYGNDSCEYFIDIDSL